MQINSIDGVLEKLGGYREVSRMCGVSDHAALMWRARGSMPSHTFLLLTAALKRKGHRASPDLWGMLPPLKTNGKARK